MNLMWIIIAISVIINLIMTIRNRHNENLSMECTLHSTFNTIAIVTMVAIGGIEMWGFIMSCLLCFVGGVHLMYVFLQSREK